MQHAHGSVAIIGSGPSGCYTALALKRAAPNVDVIVIDALPTPYGLVRHGIAPDHQGTKLVTNQFARIFTDGWARFCGDTRVGRDVPIEALTEDFDVIVQATGLPDDRPLTVEGGSLPGVIGAGTLLQYLSGHPDTQLREEAGVPSQGLGTDIVVVGTGNVALDAVRLIAKTAADLDGSDIDDDAHTRLRAADVRQITILGRGAATAAKWDASMLAELCELEHVTVTIDGTPVAPAGPDERVRVSIWFDAQPQRIERLDDTTLTLTATRLGSSLEMRVGSVISAIGFVSHENDELARLADHERVVRVGGASTGVLGNLAANRRAGQAAAAEVITKLTEQSAAHPLRPGWQSFRARLPHEPIDHSSWLRIDAAEIRRAAPNRCRQKFTTRAALRAAGLPAESA